MPSGTAITVPVVTSYFDAGLVSRDQREWLGPDIDVRIRRDHAMRKITPACAISLAKVNEQLGVHARRHDLQRFDQPRTWGPIEELIAVGHVDASVRSDRRDHGSFDDVALDEHAVKREAAGLHHDDVRTKRGEGRRVDCRSRRAGVRADGRAARELDQLWHPRAADHQRIDRFEADHARLAVRTPGALGDRTNTLLQLPAQRRRARVDRAPRRRVRRHRGRHPGASG